jgi:hypothetical protein
MLALALVVGLTGMPADAASTPTATPTRSAPSFAPGSRARQLQDVLDARAEAVRSRERGAFLQTVDAEEKDFAEAQATWFERMATLPVADYRLELDDEEDLTRSRDGERYGDPVVVAPVTERLRFEGSGDNPLAGTLFLTFVRRGGRWRIASDSGVEDLGLVSTRHPWDFGTVVVRRSEHFLLVLHPDEEPFAEQLLAEAEQAIPDVRRVWLQPWDMRVPIEVPSSGEELEAYLGGGLDVSKFVAFAISSYDPENDWRWDGSRVVLNRANFLVHPSEVRRSILAHELTHVASVGSRGPFDAIFVDEGLADLAAGLAGGPQLDRQIATGTFNRRIPEDFEFVSGTQEEILVAYQKSSSAFAHMRSRYGVEGINRFYQAYGSVKVAPGTDRYHLDRAFRDGLGISLETFEQEWGRSVAPGR